jgi:uncharacterized membrane protein HdeD (DUF308 family)
LSYAREDLPIARQIADCLREEGWSVFWDRQIPVGTTWENLIEDQLSRASCVVVLWSSTSIASDWVRAEAAAAIERGVLAPALIDATRPPLRFRMIQTADLVGWNGSREHAGLANLIAAIHALAGFTEEPKAEESALSGRILRSLDEPIAIAEIETGKDRGRSLVLTEGMTNVVIGRNPHCDFVLDEPYISRSHCRLLIQPIKLGSGGRGQYRFELLDFGSMVGTIVNNKRIDRAYLQNGDRFEIGSVHFRFRVLDEGAKFLEWDFGLKLLARRWWVLALRGVVAVLFGLLTFLVPGITLLFLVLLFGAYAILDGIFNIVWAWRATCYRWPLALEGIVGIIGGIVICIGPGLTAIVLLYVMAFWAILTGVLEIVAGILLRKHIPNEWLLIATGVISLLFGLSILISPSAVALGIRFWIGAYALVFGVMLIALAFRLLGLACGLDRTVQHA